ncbi:MAG: LysM peptidoglycan-binding domain-containing protein [Lachnospiraceae bacterium]|nr:LysM peptidoglycan-binding domain-containing protein [Lachnospiraceae bacterium]
MYKFYMDSLLLPIAPSKVTLKVNNTNKTMELINGGEINFLRTPGLSQLSLQFIIPQVKYPFAQYADGFQTADIFLNKLKELKANKKTFKFNIFRSMPQGKMLFNDALVVSIEDYTLIEDALEGFDIIADVTLKIYPKENAIAYQTIKKAAGETAIKVETARASDREAPAEYTVKKGDCLWTICKMQLGDGSKFGEIAKLNGITNPNQIYPGQVIKFS